MGVGGGELRPMREPNMRVTDILRSLGDPPFWLPFLCALTSFRKLSTTSETEVQLSAVDSSEKRAECVSASVLASTSSTSRRCPKSFLLPIIRTLADARRSDNS